MLDNGQLPGSIGCELHALIDGGSVTNALEHHGAAYYQLHRAVEVSRTRSSKRRMRPGPEFAAET
jgi:hypothetical protein